MDADLNRGCCGMLRRLAVAMLFASALAVKPAAQESSDDDIRELAQAILPAVEALDRAGLIFAGHVVGIEASGAAVRITFKVHDGIRGAQNGQTVILQEWAGLWLTGAPRYVVGGSYLVFYHRSGDSGMASLVGGDAGCLPITADERVQFTAANDPDLHRARRLARVSDGLAVPTLPYDVFARSLRLILKPQS